MQKAFAYLRVSGKGQIEGDGFTRQRAAIKSYAAAHDCKIIREFREEGVSGTKETMDRPAWAEMIAALHSNGMRTIIVEKLDRLARDLMVQEAAIADLRKYGFTLVSVQEPDLMASDPTRVLMRQLMGAVAQYDKSQIVAKLRGARMRKKAAEGHCEGRKPFGHFEGEGVVIERMKALRAEAWASTALRLRMNAEGIEDADAGPLARRDGESDSEGFGEGTVTAMGVYKRGGTYWFKFTFNGETFRESTKTNEQARCGANRGCAQDAGLAKGDVGIRDRSPVLTFEEFAKADFMPHVASRFADKTGTLAYYRVQVGAPGRGLQSLPNAKLDAVSAEAITGFIEKRRQAKYEVSNDKPSAPGIAANASPGSRMGPDRQDANARNPSARREETRACSVASGGSGIPESCAGDRRSRHRGL